MNTQNTAVPNFVSVSDLQRNYPGILKQLKKSRKPLLVLKNNCLEAVMLSGEVYREFQEKIVEWEEKEALDAVKKYEKAKKADKLMKMKNVDELFE